MRGSLVQSEGEFGTVVLSREVQVKGEDAGDKEARGHQVVWVVDIREDLHLNV